MRYMFQLVVMISDLVIIAAATFLIYIQPKNPLSYILAGLAFWTWHKQGRFFAWTPKNMKAFLANAKKLGL